MFNNKSVCFLVIYFTFFMFLSLFKKIYKIKGGSLKTKYHELKTNKNLNQ